MSQAKNLAKMAQSVTSQGVLASTAIQGGGSGGGGSSPKISSITYTGDDTAVNTAGGDTVVLTGANFVTGAQVIVNGAQVGVVTVNSSTQITFTAPANPTGSYIIYIVNPDGGTTIAVPGLQYSGVPAWTTAAGSLADIGKNSAVSITVAATGDGNVTYSVYSGTLPTGLTLNSSTGVISGTAPDVTASTTYNFVIRATDTQNQDTDRNFSITIQPNLYAFSSFTFTNASSTGMSAPSKSTLLSSYNTATYPWLNNTEYFNTTPPIGVEGGFQLWTVPVNGTYRIVCTGASGGASGARGGYGAVVTADISLTLGDKYRILVGHKPPNSGQSGSGGGASAFWKDSAPTVPIIVAGAGGGGSGTWSGYAYQNQPGQDAQPVGAAGGVGLGPSAKPTAATGGNGGNCVANQNGAGPGGGWYTNGQINGAGTNSAGPGYKLYNNAYAGNAGDYAAPGGFGGGGGGRNVIAGGGGGYNGGGCPQDQNNCASGGGGSSFVGNGATLVTDVQTNTGHGSVTITKI